MWSGCISILLSGVWYLEMQDAMAHGNKHLIFNFKIKGFLSFRQCNKDMQFYLILRKWFIQALWQRKKKVNEHNSIPASQVIYRRYFPNKSQYKRHESESTVVYNKAREVVSLNYLLVNDDTKLFHLIRIHTTCTRLYLNWFWL